MKKRVDNQHLFFVEENTMNHCYGSKVSDGFSRLALIIWLLFAMFAVDLSVHAADHANGISAQKTAFFLESIRDQPGMVYAFLRQMPKGGDLHSHLSGPYLPSP